MKRPQRICILIFPVITHLMLSFYGSAQQAEGVFVKVFDSNRKQLYAGRLVSVGDSSLSILAKTDTYGVVKLTSVHYTEVGLLRIGRPGTTGLLTGMALGAVAGVIGSADSGGLIDPGEATLGLALWGGILGFFSGGIVGALQERKVEGSYDKFTAEANRLRKKQASRLKHSGRIKTY